MEICDKYLKNTLIVDLKFFSQNTLQKKFETDFQLILQNEYLMESFFDFLRSNSKVFPKLFAIFKDFSR